MFAVSQTLATLTPSEFEKEVAKLSANFSAVSAPLQEISTQELKEPTVEAGPKASSPDVPVDMEL